MLSRFQHILLPLDFSTKNQPAIDMAVEMAVQHDARVSLLHVIEKVNVPEDDELHAFYVELESRARTELAARAKRFAEPQIATTQRVVFGPRAEEIVRYEQENSVDLIIMSSHTVDPEKPINSLSTVSYKVSLLCSCPVLLMKQRSD